MKKENPFEIVYRFERRANFLRSRLGLIIIHCIEKGREKGRGWENPPLAQLSMGYLFIFFRAPTFIIFGIFSRVW